MGAWLSRLWNDPDFVASLFTLTAAKVRALVFGLGVGINQGIIPLTKIGELFGDSCTQGSTCGKWVWMIGGLIAIGAVGIRAGDKTADAMAKMPPEELKPPEPPPSEPVKG